VGPRAATWTPSRPDKPSPPWPAWLTRSSTPEPWCRHSREAIREMMFVIDYPRIKMILPDRGHKRPSYKGLRPGSIITIDFVERLASGPTQR
jgi:hypothetical protein